MAKKKTKIPNDPPGSYSIHATDEDTVTQLYRHYLWGVQDMDTRRTRKNGWNDVINAYMGKVPVNWPYNSVVTNPVIRTTILEKTSRLLNAKLQGRLIPRQEDSNMIKAKINNALLDFQWDYANEGGPMIQKVAEADQYCRIFGASFVLVYWNVKKETNDIKIIDPRDLFFDGAATHIRNARWVQVREFTTFDKLEERGYDVKDARAMAERGEITAEMRSSRYESIVKANRGLMDRTGLPDDLKNPIVEMVTEWGFDRDQKPYCRIFLPKYMMMIYDGENPYKHGKIPLAMLRYYPLVDDIYGESEAEPVLGLYRAIQAMVCGFLDECNIKLRPPIKIIPTAARVETIEFGPGAKWIVNDPNAVTEYEGGQGYIAAFNSVYPMLVSAFDTAMGNQSLGISSGQSTATHPSMDNPTATEVMSEERQQNNRDQYNQLHLAEFLEDIMMMWLSNNKQYLFDDPTKKAHVLKIVGKDLIKELQQYQLDQTDIPDDAMNQIAQTMAQNPEVVTPDMLNDVIKDVRVPVNPVIMNPNEPDPSKYEVKKKLDVKYGGQEADLYITPDDFEGEYEYIPDVKSMAAGAGMMMQKARQQAMQLVMDPEVMQMLQTQGQMLKMKEILVANLEDAGYKDADSLFEPLNQQPGQPGGVGPGAVQPGFQPNQPPTAGGMGQVPQAIPNQPGPGGIPGSQGLPGQQ